MKKNQLLIFDDTPNSLENFLENKSINNILLITGKKSFKDSGAKFFLSGILNTYNVTKISNFSSNPKLLDLKKIKKNINWSLVDCVIGIGGGSVIDMSKLLCYYKDCDEINLEKKSNKFNRDIPLITIPTTAGSGSEATHFSVIYDANNNKHSIAHPDLLPDLTILNYKLSYNLNAYLKAVSGLDALCQAIESLWSLRATKESYEYSLDSLELIVKNLHKSVVDNDLEAHKMMVKASNLAGQAINIAKTTACHALSYYFTSKFGLSHGHAVSLTLGSIYEFNHNKALKSSDPNSIKIFNDLNSQLNIFDNFNFNINKLVNDLGIDLDLINLNIKINLDELHKSVNIERLKNNPFPLSKTDINNIILNL